MSCPSIPTLEDFLTAEAIGSEHDDLDAHIADCPSCRAQLLDVRKNLEFAGRFSLGSLTDTTDPIKPSAPRFIGKYKVIATIGHGGMGVVYEAVHRDTGRQVAIKVVPGGVWGDPRRVQLLQREARILARLQHSFIAAIHEAGQADDGAQFVAMELVHGRPLNEYVRSGRLPTKDRLHLFQRICEGINYAHQHGVIHLDLKPSNILIHEDGQPKVLDFGLSRIVESDSTHITSLSHRGRFQGTLPYMSPEQVRGDPQHVSVRCDVYALGVVLYELLTGRLPFGASHRSFASLLDEIRDATPPRPGSLNRALRGDLETIILHTLEKDPERRYQSVLNLSEDIRRYLGHQPILARPPSTVYQVRKYAQRHKALFGVGTAAFVLLVLGLMGTAFGFYRAAQRLRDAEAAFTMIEQVMVVNDKEKSIPIGELIDRLSDNATTQIAASPLYEARVRLVTAAKYWKIGDFVHAQREYGRAAQIFERELGTFHPKARFAKMRCAIVSYYGGDYEAADSHLSELLDYTNQHLSEFDYTAYHVLDLQGVIIGNKNRVEAAQKADRLVALSRKHLGADNPETVNAMSRLASILVQLGQFDKAEPLLRDAEAIAVRIVGEDDSLTWSLAGYRFNLYLERGQYARAEPLAFAIMNRNLKRHGEQHRRTIQSICKAGLVRYHQGRLDEAVELLERSVALSMDFVGPNRDMTLRLQRHLAIAYSAQGRFATAEALFLVAYENSRRSLGEKNWVTLFTMHRLAGMYVDAARFEDAAPYVDQIRSLADEFIASDNWYGGAVLATYGAYLAGLQDFDGALPILIRAHEFLAEKLDPQHTEVRRSIRLLEALYRATGDDNRADEWRTRLCVSTLATDGNP